MIILEAMRSRYCDFQNIRTFTLIYDLRSSFANAGIVLCVIHIVHRRMPGLGSVLIVKRGETCLIETRPFLLKKVVLMLLSAFPLVYERLACPV